jgi:ribonuclease HI
MKPRDRHRVCHPLQREPAIFERVLLWRAPEKTDFLMQTVMLFTDGSVNAQSKIGYGAYLAVFGATLSAEELDTQVQVKRFEQTSSTRLELQTLLWALNDLQATGCKVMIYTDSQNIIGLPGRRQRLEQKDYRTAKNTRLKNFVLYREFYRLTDLLNCELVKVHGHMAAKHKAQIDRLFTLVDRASRLALREDS